MGVFFSLLKLTQQSLLFLVSGLNEMTEDGDRLYKLAVGCQNLVDEESEKRKIDEAAVQITGALKKE